MGPQGIEPRVFRTSSERLTNAELLPSFFIVNFFLRWKKKKFFDYRPNNRNGLAGIFKARLSANASRLLVRWVYQKKNFSSFFLVKFFLSSQRRKKKVGFEPTASWFRCYLLQTFASRKGEAKVNLKARRSSQAELRARKGICI